MTVPFSLIPDIALSVRQPWALALALGWKPVENRSWRKPNPGLKFRGPIAIHASSGMTRAEYEDAAAFIADMGHTVPPPAELRRGGIVGVATVTDMVTEFDSPWFFGRIGILMADAQPVDFVPVGGRLGFFEWRPLLPFAGKGKPVEPAKWMLPAAPRSPAREPAAASAAPSAAEPSAQMEMRL